MKGPVLVLGAFLASAGIPGNMQDDPPQKTASHAAALQTGKRAEREDPVLKALERELVGRQPVSRDPTRAVEDYLRSDGRGSPVTLFPVTSAP